MKYQSCGEQALSQLRGGFSFPWTLYAGMFFLLLELLEQGGVRAAAFGRLGREGGERPTSRLKRQSLLGRAGRPRGWWGSMCFHHSAIAVSAEVQVVRRKLLICLFSDLCTGSF